MADPISSTSIKKPTDANSENGSTEGSTSSDNKPTSTTAPKEDNSGNSPDDTRPQAPKTDSVSGTMMRAVDEPQTTQSADKKEPQISDNELALRAVNNFAKAAGIYLTQTEAENIKLAVLGGGDIGTKVADNVPKILGNERMLEVLAMARDAGQGAKNAGVTPAQDFKLETGVNFETQLANRGQQQSGGIEIANP